MKLRHGAPLARRSAFPLRSPTWPGGVERLPIESKTGMDFDTEWARRYPVRLARAVVLDGVTRPAVRVLAAPQIRGLDRLGGLEAPAVFASNHASHVDTPLLLTSLPARFRHRTIVAAAADYFFDTRWKGAMWAFVLNAIPIERTKVSRRSADLTATLVDEGWSVVIYPEGGRTPDGWTQPFRGGAAYVSIRCSVPVVPVHIEGTRRILRRGAKQLRPSTTTVTFGAPMRPDDGEDARGFAARIEAAVATLADEQATDWWTARRRAARGGTPSLSGPTAGAWRRTWALGENRRSTGPDEAPWPKL
jgi:1-acyl-sn-glycerol-3-phosphate acyltransferase